jgi:hypothetical protein
MPILDAVRRFLRGLRVYWEREQGMPSETVDAYLAELFDLFPFTSSAQRYLRERVRVQIDDLSSLTGGGGWYPGQRLVRLHTAQYEAAIHELAHAVWEERRRDRQERDALVAAVQQLAGDARWGKVHKVAHDYVHGIPEQPGFEQGMLLPAHEWGTGGGSQGEWNDWEMYAGLASACMADVRRLPPYLRPFYADLFRTLPGDAPPPESRARHA